MTEKFMMVHSVESGLDDIADTNNIHKLYYRIIEEPTQDMVLSGSLVNWCFEPSQPHWITSGLKTNFTLSPSFSVHKSLYQKPLFLKPQLN